MRLRPTLFLLGVSTLLAFGCKETKNKSETKPEAEVIAKAPKDAPVVPWRVGFGLDDSKRDVFIPRPGTPDAGTKIISFVAKRAKDIATWERIELELASGENETLAPDATMDYELRQHEGAGVDLVLFAQDGSRHKSIGPLKRLHIYTKSQAVAAPRIDGKATLVLTMGETREELAPADLAAIEQHVIAGGSGQKAWKLSEVLATKVDVTTIKSLKISAVGETRRFGEDEFASADTTFYLRHNSRGELRLKVVRSEVEDEAAGIRDVARIDIELRKAK